LASFLDRWKGSIAIDHVLSGIVGGESKRQIPSKSIEELSQILGSPSDIIFGVVEVSYIQPDCRLRHQLHQSNSSSPRDGAWVKVRLGLNDGTDQGGVKLMFSGKSADHRFQLFF